MEKLQTYRKEVDKKLAEFNLVRATFKTENEELEKCCLEIENIMQAQILTQNVAQQIQEKVHSQIASIVTKCLTTVFEEPYTFKIRFEQKRGKTECLLLFERDGEEIDPMTASGGGVVDIASFALRLACLVLKRPNLRRVLILDEPFRFVSDGLRGRLRVLLETLSKEMQVQFIIVTHMDELQIGNVIEI